MTYRAFSRRRFLIMGCGALCAAALGSGCVSRQAQGEQATACPYGEVNDAYPGKCHRYVDANGNGICDYSELTQETAEALPAATATATAGGTNDGQSSAAASPRRTATKCPRRLVNDPYPGRCRLYTDRSGNGICDLSEAV